MKKTKGSATSPGDCAARPDTDQACVPPSRASAGEGAPRRQWIGFGFLLLAMLITVLDASAASIAVPSIAADLQISAGPASLLMTVQLVVASSLIILMGKVSDLIGAKKVFLLGAGLFTVGSLITSVAPNFGVLMLGRVVQGLVVALVTPAILSLMNHEFPCGRPRALAFSIRTAVIGSGLTLGLLISGLLSTYASWRWIFLMNIPFMVTAAIGAGVSVRPVTVKLKEKGFDIAGSILLVLSAILITFGLQEATDLGWWTAKPDALVGGVVPWPFSASVTPFMLILGVVLLLLFTLVEKDRARRTKSAVLDFKLFAVRSFTWGTSAAALMATPVFAIPLLIALYGQYILGLDPLGTGAMVVPLGIGVSAGGPILSRVNWPPHTTLLITLIIQPIALLGLLPLVQPDGQAWWLALVLAVYGFAWGAAYSILVSTLLADVPQSLSGVAAGTQSAFRKLASAIAVAALTTILLGSVMEEMSGVSESELTAKEKSEITQLYEFSPQVHPPTTDSGQTVHTLRTAEPFDRVIQETEDNMSAGVRFALLGAAFLSFLGFLCGLKLDSDEKA
ncbi:MAG: MFS transporter [Candidatus Nanopelagicales bacterium]|nr:MFS transporter [Candidatus Nanopelagicales bacterium]